VNNSLFINLYDVRYLQKPIGLILNVWGSYLIAFGGLIGFMLYVYRKNKYIFIYSVILSITLSHGIITTFSRAIYISFALFLAFIYVFIFSSVLSLKKKLLLSFSMLMLLSLLALPYKGDVFRTVRIVETSSQIRSIEGRMKMAKNTYKLYNQPSFDKWLGVGNGNFSLANNQFQYENDNYPFTGYAGSVIFQVLIENGVIGLILLFTILLFLFYSLFKQFRTDFGLYLILAAIVSFFMRELFFSSFIETIGIQFIIFALIAICQYKKNHIYKVTVSLNKKRKTVISLLLITLCIIETTLLYERNKDEEYNTKAISALKFNDLMTANAFIAKTNESLPYLINRSIINWALFRNINEYKYLHEAKRYLSKALDKNPSDNLLIYNYATILNVENKMDSSILILNQLISKYPNNSLYNIGMFNALYKDGYVTLAKKYLVNAICLSPNVLESSFWKSIIKNDSIYGNTVLEEAITQISTDCNDPIINAKNGKILLYYGDTIKAEILIHKSLHELPMLSKPWQNLAFIEYGRDNIEKGDLYMKQSYMLDKTDSISISYCINVEEKKHLIMIRTNQDINFYTKYHILKFQRWYKSNTSADFLIFDTI
jgi:tetratricopeptide (TPR) repeat protein